MSQQINLYNASFIPKRELVTGKTLALATGVLYLLLAVVSTWAVWNAKEKAAQAAAAQTNLKMAQEAMNLARAANEARKPSAALQAEITRTRQLFAMREEVLAILGKGTGERGAGFGEYLTGLARQSREGLWLSGFSVTAGGSGMSLGGRTLDKALLPEYVRRLNNEPAFAGKAFAGLRMEYRELAPVAGSASTATGAVPPAPTLPARYIDFQLTAEDAVSAEKKP